MIFLVPLSLSNLENVLHRYLKITSRRGRRSYFTCIFFLFLIKGIAGISEEHQLLLKTFPNPKGILNNVILSNAKCSSIQDVVTYKTEDIPAEKKGAQVLKKSILTLNWPEVMEVEGSGRKKRGAELVAAALACAKLKVLWGDSIQIINEIDG